jgi:uncharacterized membrane protein
MMDGSVILDPLVPLALIWAGAALSVLAVALALWRGLSGWWLRAAAALVLIAAVLNPALQREERQPLSDIVIAVVDESASQKIGDRPAQTGAALENLRAQVAALPDTELRVVRVGDGPDNAGTLLLSALSEAMAGEPRARIAGAVLISDGHAHDLAAAPDMPAPLHLLLTGRATDWDRRLIVKNAPAYAIINEQVTLTLHIEDQGAVPASVTGTALLSIAVDGGPAQEFRVPVNEDLALPVTLDHGGLNVLQFSVALTEGELTDRNNVAVVQINGVRDRLRVLLVSGEPHAGERTWRNLLKSDASVDLVHFTILRPPEKQDGVPVSELSLIAFPTRELFVDKIGEFDLIIFDRYRRRGILPASYLDNVRDYVRGGGAVLVAAGPEFGSADSLYRSSLAEVLPGAPTAQVIERGYLPRVAPLGAKHPVTAGLQEAATTAATTAGGADADTPGWGRWFRLVDVTPTPEAEVVMTGADDRPLLLLDRVGAGRVALLASDQAWLWGRGFEGGGPQLELLRRLAHWMMKEPDLEEEALTATAEGQTLAITRRTLGDGPREVTITGPDGAVTTLPLAETAPGRFAADWQAPDIGLYRLAEGDAERVIALGPSAPREFEETVATDARIKPLVTPTRGGTLRLEDGVPDVRQVSAGRAAAGRGWIGITPRGAYVTADITVQPLLPAWLMLLIAALLAIGAWLWEGRRERRIRG